MKHYDYIIAGMGCAGLSFAMHLIDQKLHVKKKILLVDKSLKTTNDRTWCFWEKNTGIFEPVVFKSWDHLKIRDETFERTEHIAPYRYKMIRSIDFYNYCKAGIKKEKNFEIRTGAIQSIDQHDGKVIVKIDDELVSGDFVFSSMYEKPVLKKHEFYLLQHFKGKVISAEKSCFDPQTALLMDFSVPQKNETAFVYLLPFNEKEALVEYTVFGKNTFPDVIYDEGIENYLQKKLSIGNYSVSAIEKGVIPMTNYNFPASIGKVIYLGMAGGQTKASTGYTFQFIQEQCSSIVQAIKNGKSPTEGLQSHNRRARFYDAVLLRILHDGSLGGKEIFIRLFKRNPIKKVLSFLSNSTSVFEEIQIVSTLQWFPFALSAFRTLLKRK